MRKFLQAVAVKSNNLIILCLAFVFFQTAQAQTAYVMSSGNKTWDLAGTWTVSGGTYTGTDAGNWASVGIIGSGTSVTSGTRTTKSSASIVTGTNGGFQKPSGTIQFLSTGSGSTPEAVAVDLLLDFTGRNAGTLSFDWAAIDNGSGTRPTSLRVFWSTDGTTFTEIAGAQLLDKESATAPASGSVSSIALPTQFNNSASARLRFYNHAGSNAIGSGTRDKMQIDNIAITSTSAGTLPPPSLTPASGVTVDASFNVTFTDDATWRAAITSITVGGTALPPAAYSTGTAGQITFTPSASGLLQSAGSKSIVVIATGYTNASVTQAIASGAATKLSVTTQPAAPSTNGAALATQPVITIQDQYGNGTTSTASVSAAVGAGVWTIGGTTTVSAINGTATFTNLTATSAALVSGATIAFSSAGLTSATSSTFTIPAPPPATLSTGGTTTLSFGSQTSLTNSTSQSFNLSGSNLTGAPGNITVSAPNTDFQVSNNNSTWAATTTIGYSSATLASSPVYVRFSPQSSGAKSGNITFSGGGVSAPPTVALSGTGNLTVPVANAATNIVNAGFTANWSTVSEAVNGYALEVGTNSSFSAPLISQGFESTTFPPTGWTTTGWTRSTAAADIKNGGAAAIAGSNTGTLTTAAVSKPTSISFYLGRSNNSTAKTLTIEVSTTSQASGFTPVATFDHSNVPSASYDQYSVDLSAYSSFSTVYIRFNKSSSTTSPWRLDDIVINGLAGLVTGYDPLLIPSQGTNSALITGLSPNTTYYYRVKSADANGVSANSNVVTVTTSATFRTTGSGNFSSIGSWEYFNGSSYVPATQVPATIDDITVQSGHILSLDQNFTVGSGNTFTVATGGSLVIADNATLDMADNTGTINFNGQPVTVKSTATGTGSIGQVPGTLSGATNVTLERFIPQNATRGWRLLAANTSGQDIRDAWQESGATVSDLGTQITGASTLFANNAAAQAAGFDKRTPGSSILFYDQPNDSLNALASTTVNIATHPAYFLYIRGDRSGDFTTNTTVKATTLRSTGTIASGSQALNILPVSTNNTNGFNILGNPFASAIDMRTVMATRSNTTDISEDFQVWDPKVLGTYGLGGFQTFTRSGTNYVVTPGGGSYQANNGPVSEYNNIESGAGFVVTNTGASSGTITIAENAKVSASREVQRPAGTLAVPGLVKTNLYAMNTGSPVLADGNLVLVDDSYSNSIDIADARKIPNFGENFGIEKLGNLLAVEKRKAFVESDIIAFSMSKLKAVAYRLEITTEAVDAGLVAYLDDSYTKIQTPLSNQGTTTYDFNVNADAASAAANRFQIVFKSLGGALPVSFIRFAATKANNDVVLDWKVGNQQGVSKYEVEKSADGRTFVTVASVTAADGQDVYSWTDNNVIAPKLYYRVRAVEADGSSKLTDIASIVTNKQAGIKLVTNLARANEAVKLEFVGQQAGKYNIRLVNSLGQVMYRNFISYVGGSGYQQFTIPSQLAGGTYQLEIVTPGKTKSVQRLVIQ